MLTSLSKTCFKTLLNNSSKWCPFWPLCMAFFKIERKNGPQKNQNNFRDDSKQQKGVFIEKTVISKKNNWCFSTLSTSAMKKLKNHSSNVYPNTSPDLYQWSIHIFFSLFLLQKDRKNKSRLVFKKIFAFLMSEKNHHDGVQKQL